MRNLRTLLTGWILRGFDLLNKLLGVNVRYFAKNATIMTFSYGISIMRGLITGYLVARMFPRELYGQYQFILSMAGTVGVLSLPGLVSATGRAIARGEQGIIMPIARIQFAIALIGSAVLLLIVPFLPQERASLWPLFVLAAMLFPVSQTASGVFSAATIGKTRFDVALKANMAWSSVMAASALAIIFLHPSAALLYAAGTGLPALAYLWFSRKLINHNEPRAPIKHILKYGVQLTLVSLPVSLSWYVDKLMISSLFGLNQLAVFSVGIQIPEQMKTLAKELLPVSFAVQAQGDDTMKRRMRLMSATARGTALFAIGIAVYIVAAPYLLAIVYPNYPEAVFLSQLAAITLIAQPATLLTQYLEAQAMIKPLQWTQWFSAAVFVVSLVTLIPAFGLPGAVIARGMLRLSYSLCAIFCMFVLPPAVNKQTV
jgi:O-antigen/teichoic acid export membrane protein